MLEKLIIGVWVTSFVVTTPLLFFVKKRLEGVPLLAYLVNCPFCLGFWVGLAIFQGQMSGACLTSGVSALFISVLNFLEGDS
jgi:hypothetical protein